MKRDRTTGIYRMTLTGERAPGQTPLETVCMVPRPAEKDDWRLCRRIEEREFRKAGKEREFPEWVRREKGDSIG